MTTTPPGRELVRQAIEALGGRGTNTQIRDAILARFPGVNPGAISAQINIYTVNSPSRIHCPENQKPRRATDPRYDLLYRVGRGQRELYDPERHGAWEIAKDGDGRLHVAPAGEQPGGDGPPVTVVEPPESEVVQAHSLFGLERHLRDFLAANIGSLAVWGAALSLYVNDSGLTGGEYPTGVGPIDIHAVDASDALMVFELKLGRGPDAAAGQLARYMGWVKRHLAGDREVRGVIVARSVDEKLRYAASIVPNVALFEYAMSFTLHPAGEV